jgi:hypothetical protein
MASSTQQQRHLRRVAGEVPVRISGDMYREILRYVDCSMRCLSTRNVMN